MAIGSKRKALLPLASAAIEYALVRRGEQVLVSCYGTASAPVYGPIAQGLLERIAGADRVELEDLDHMAPVLQPDAIAAAVERFFER